jgi:alcohol dehydrogenase class IV
MTSSFEFNTPGCIVFGAGSMADFSSIVGPLLGEHVLLVTDTGVRSLGLTEAAEKSLTASGWSLTVFESVEPDPSLATLEACVSQGIDAGVTGVLGVGGGSSLDVAKLAALLIGSRENLDGAWGVGQAKGPRLPLVLVPTTAGTGSEVTPVAIITVSDEEKRGVSSPLIIPDIALLDPELTVGLPPQHTAATGVDAMVHAIEAYTSVNSNNNPISKMLACEALRRAGAHIERAVHHGQDLEARSELLLAAMFAGQAFANAPVAAVHALAYPLGSMFHIPHGLSNALVLPHVLRFNAPECVDAYSVLADAAFPKRGAGSDIATLFEELISKLNMPARLRDVGVPKDAIGPLASAATAQTRLLVNNPRTVSEAEARTIYEAAW